MVDVNVVAQKLKEIYRRIERTRAVGAEVFDRVTPRVVP
jgi:hypothetical protein